MKEAYIYKEDQIIAADIKEDKCKEVRYNYQDNIEKILRTENIIEYLSQEKEKINNELKNITKHIKIIENQMPTILASWLYYSILSVGFGTIMGLFTNIWMVMLAMPLLITIICTTTVICNEIHSNILSRKERGYKLELQKVNEQLDKNTTHLKKLKKNKKTTTEKMNEISRKFNHVEYKEKLEELKKLLETYRLIGKNIELYKKYYKKGILEEKLKDKFEDNQIKLIKKYLNGKTKHN